MSASRRLPRFFSLDPSEGERAGVRGLPVGFRGSNPDFAAFFWLILCITSISSLPLTGAEATNKPPFKVISQGEAAGTYQAFPDVCRLKNGDLLAVFYAGYTHISVPSAEFPKGGRICM